MFFLRLQIYNRQEESTKKNSNFILCKFLRFMYVDVCNAKKFMQIENLEHMPKWKKIKGTTKFYIQTPYYICIPAAHFHFYIYIQCCIYSFFFNLFCFSSCAKKKNIINQKYFPKPIGIGINNMLSVIHIAYRSL